MPDLDRVADLTARTLDHFDDQANSTAAILRRCKRIASLRNDYPNLLWLEFESMDMGSKTAERLDLGPKLLLHFDRDEADALFQRAYDEHLARRRLDPKSEGVFPGSVEQLEAQILRVRMAGDTLDSPPGLAPIDLYHRTEEVSRIRIATIRSLAPLEDVLSRIRGRIHRFLVETEQQLEYGQVNADIFERTRAAVDEQLGALAPQALEMFTSAYRRVREGDDESYSHALTSCRRILKATADIVYPPQNQDIVGADGKSRKMSEDRYLNRLVQAVSEAVGKHGLGAITQATLRALGERLTALDNLASKGVHAKVSAAEVDVCVVQTYLMIGDVLRIVRGQSGLLTAEEALDSH